MHIKRDTPQSASDLDRALTNAISSFQSGNSQYAEETCEKILSTDPTHAEALHLKAIITCHHGQHAAAIDLFQSAIRKKPAQPEYHHNLGNAFRDLDRLEQAATCYEQALLLQPDYIEAWNNLGTIFYRQGKFDQALSTYQKALLLKPNHATTLYNQAIIMHAQGRHQDALLCCQKALEAKEDFPEVYCQLGDIFLDQGKPDAAIRCFRQALRLGPMAADCHFKLALALQEQGEVDEAAACYKKAIELAPAYAFAYNNLGNILQKQGRLMEAEVCLRQALEFIPDQAEIHANLGNTMKGRGRLTEAEASIRRALALTPDHAKTHSHLGSVFLAQGRPMEAEASYRRALELDPGLVEAHTSLLFALNYHPDKSGETIFEAYQEYDQRFGIPFRSEWRPHHNRREPGRRLKVGYVSPDFRRHSVHHFLEPLLANHNQEVVEVYAYAELVMEDEATARYKGYADHWVPTITLNDDALAERIRADGIDILVDLAGQTANNRLGVFARKPAPVSISWLGYGYTTGLTAIDYFLADDAMVPAGSEGLFSETPWRLPAPGFAYRPAEGMGSVTPLPAAERGHVTFGTLTRAIRINHRTIRVWAEILKRVPGARLMIDSGNYTEPAMQANLAKKFEDHGISRERLQIGYHSPPWDVLRGMDIGLDSFPHNSGTTLWENLYMGVPFITLAGRPSVGRLGSSILEGLGHPEWIAETEEGYVEIAVALASDLPRLAMLRAGLRAEMETGPLMDEQAFARKVESAYREMFARWCTEKP